MFGRAAPPRRIDRPAADYSRYRVAGPEHWKPGADHQLSPARGYSAAALHAATSAETRRASSSSRGVAEQNRARARAPRHYEENEGDVGRAASIQTPAP